MKRFNVTISRCFTVEAVTEREAQKEGLLRFEESFKQTRKKEDFFQSLSKKSERVAPKAHECPFCYSTHIEGGQLEVNGEEVTQPLCCHSCNEDWDESYIMRGRYKKDGFAIFLTGN